MVLGRYVQTAGLGGVRSLKVVESRDRTVVGSFTIAQEQHTVFIITFRVQTGPKPQTPVQDAKIIDNASLIAR